jgi:Helix-turn-helix domain
MDDGVGKTLEAARTRRDLDLSEVEASTRIRVRYLRAIEDEDWDVLPAEAYARGFIRTYAGFLGLDGAELDERYRSARGTDRPAEERFPGVDPAPPRPLSRQHRRLSPRTMAIVVSAAVAVALVAIGLSTGGGESPPPRLRAQPDASRRAPVTGAEPRPSSPVGVSLTLAASAEVWICLLDGRGVPIVDSQILGPGAVEGPYRSGSFTVSLGNGEVTMTVDGQQANIPATPSPIGFAIGPDGRLRELAEGERPTCT